MDRRIRKDRESAEEQRRVPRRRGRGAFALALLALATWAVASCGGGGGDEGGGGSGGGGGGGGGGGSPEKPALEVVDLGTYSVPADGPASPYVEVPLDGAVTGFGLVALKPDSAPGVPWFDEILAPSGFALVTSGEQDTNPIRGGQSDYPAACVQIPNSQRYPFETGDHKASLLYTPYIDRDSNPQVDLDLKALIARRRDLSRGVMDVNFFFTSIPWIDAASAPSNENFQTALAVLSYVYSQAGVTFGKVGYFDLPEGAAERLAVIDYETDADQDGKSDDAEELFSYSSLDTSDSLPLNFFFIREFTKESVIGQAAGIPGAFFLKGTPMSGVAVVAGSTEDGTARGITLLGETIAHEGLHYLGLYHTSESKAYDGIQNHDLTDDTPECRVATDDWDGDGAVGTTDCWTLGAWNDMFWNSAPVRQELLTPGQQWVVQRNPMIRDGVGVPIGDTQAVPPVSFDGDAIVYYEEEPNERGNRGGSFGTPVTIIGGAAESDTVEIHTPEGDPLQDLYAVELDAGWSYDFSLEPIETAGDADLDIYLISLVGDMEFVASSNGEGSSEAFSYSVPSTGTYVIAVSAYQDSAVYRLRIR